MPSFRRRSVPFYLTLFAIILFLLLFGFAKSPEIPSIVLPSPSMPPLSPTATVLGETESQPSNEELYPVIRVVDGDTIIVSVQGVRQTIRLIGINTPETVDPRRETECFGKEASEKAKTILTNQHVRLEADPTQTERDRYNRLLRYVYLADGRLFNKVLIEEGYAFEYTYSTPYLFQKEFKEAEQSAKNEGKGLWGEATCRGNK